MKDLSLVDHDAEAHRTTGREACFEVFLDFVCANPYGD